MRGSAGSEWTRSQLLSPDCFVTGLSVIPAPGHHAGEDPATGLCPAGNELRAIHCKAAASQVDHAELGGPFTVTGLRGS